MARVSEQTESIAQSVFVLSLGIFSCAAAYAFGQYVLFVEQVLRLPCGHNQWLGPPLGLGAWFGGVVDARDAAKLPAFVRYAAALQIFAFGLAFGGYSQSRASQTPLRNLSPPRPATPSASGLALALAAMATSALSTLAYGGVMAHDVEGSYALIWRAWDTAADVAQKATLLAQGESGALGTFKFGSLLALPLVTSLAATCSISALALLVQGGRRRALALEPIGPDAARAWAHVPSPPLSAVVMACATLVLFGICPLCIGAFLFSGNLIQALSELVNLPVEIKVAHIVEALTIARPELELLLRISIAGILLATAVALVLLIILPARRRRALAANANRHSRPRWRAPLLASAALWAASALVLSGAARYRKEGADPINAEWRNGFSLPPGTATLPLEAPDAIEIAPLLEVTPTRVALDGRPENESSLRQDLATLRDNWLILHPNQPFVGALLVACASGVKLARVQPLLAVAQRGDWRTLQWAFGQWRVQHRPVLGRVSSARFSAVRIEFFAPADGSPQPSPQPAVLPAVLDFDPTKSCDDFGPALIALRRTGRRVQLRLPLP